ncbi:hypothetical protein NMY22_g10908 [Coprinellus aureogranulatus]|nr:hypothetical protein NMY22_g10908 [Coprinellus aureogranulatus]
MATLVVSADNPLVSYPPYGALANLVIPGPILIANLLHEQAAEQIHISCASLTRLEVVHLNECQFTEEVSKKVFDFLQSLTRLTKLVITDFILPEPDRLRAPPSSVGHTSLSIEELEIVNTHGASLSYLFQRIEPKNLILDSCSHIHDIPNCAMLKLYRIPAFAHHFPALVKWDGLHLILDSSPFFTNAFIVTLTMYMFGTRGRIWPNARLDFRGYPLSMGKGILNLLEYRQRHPRTPGPYIILPQPRTTPFP